jgi:hypothetical protein
MRQRQLAMKEAIRRRHEWERGSAYHERLLLLCAACGARLVESDPDVEDWKGRFNSHCPGRID